MFCEGQGAWEQRESVCWFLGVDRTLQASHRGLVGKKAVGLKCVQTDRLRQPRWVLHSLQALQKHTMFFVQLIMTHVYPRTLAKLKPPCSQNLREPYDQKPSWKSAWHPNKCQCVWEWQLCETRCLCPCADTGYHNGKCSRTQGQLRDERRWGRVFA